MDPPPESVSPAPQGAEETSSELSVGAYDLVLVLVLSLSAGLPVSAILLPWRSSAGFLPLLLGVPLLWMLCVSCARQWRRPRSPRLGVELARAGLLAVPPGCVISGAALAVAELLPRPPQLAVPVSLAAAGTGALSAYVIVLAARLRAARGSWPTEEA